MRAGLVPLALLVSLGVSACKPPSAPDAGLALDAGAAGCDAGCATGEVCLRDACFPVTCEGGACGPDEVCEAGQCIARACAGLACPEATKCLRGRCFASQCGAQPCDAGAVCDGTRCVDERCAGLACPAGVACREGACTECLPGYLPLDGGCAPVRAAGQACGAAAECETGVCANGRCCLTPCLGQCEGCDETGQCRSLARGALGAPPCFPGLCGGNRLGCVEDCVGDADCASGAFCDRSGPSARCLPTLRNGAACTRASQCSSQLCVNGLCCDTPCDGGCATCNGLTATGLPSGTPVGTCSPVPVGTTPRATCGPFLCDGLELDCPTTCGTDRACVSNRWCGGEPLTCANPLLGNGAACDRSRQCLSGFCVDGVCCGSACAGECAACNLPGREGLCAGESGTRATDGGYCADGVVCGEPCAGPCGVCVGGVCGRRTDNGSAGACGNFGCQPSTGDGGCAQTCVLGTTIGCAEGFFCDPTPVTGAPRCVLRRVVGGSCDGGDQCASGACCDAKCRELMTDSQHCGACGNACDATTGGSTCQWGACCERCNGIDCTDLRQDNQNCGSCYNSCSGNDLCTGGTCCETCGTSACVDFSTDSMNCGVCGQTCGADQACITGTCCDSCGTGLCLDFNFDPDHCGGCGRSCNGGTCTFGTCG